MLVKCSIVYAIKEIFHFWHIIPILLVQVTYECSQTPR
jgi:hypothetical protein